MHHSLSPRQYEVQSTNLFVNYSVNVLNWVDWKSALSSQFYYFQPRQYQYCFALVVQSPTKFPLLLTAVKQLKK